MPEWSNLPSEYIFIPILSFPSIVMKRGEWVFSSRGSMAEAALKVEEKVDADEERERERGQVTRGED